MAPIVSLAKSIDWNLVTSVSTAVAAYFAAQAIIGHKKAQEASTFLDFTKWYNTSAIDEALFHLIGWRLKAGDGFASEFSRLFAERSDTGRELDAHRRRLNRYFTNIAQLYRARLISRRLARVLTDVSALNVYYQVVVPMNQAKYGDTAERKAIVETLRAIRRQYGDGRVAPGSA